MTYQREIDRRQFVSGALGVGAAVGLAGCGGFLTGGPDLEYGDEVEGEISDGDPTDPKYDDLSAKHAFEGAAGDAVGVDMDSNSFDTYLILTGPDDSVVDENDDSAGSRNSHLTTILPEDGTYTIWAGSYSGSATGPYSLELYDATADAATVEVGGTHEGQIVQNGPVDPRYDDLADPVQFTVDGAGRVAVSMHSEEFDTYLVVTGEDGSFLVEDDDGGSDLNSQLVADLPEAGTYTVWAGSFSGRDTGSYTLEVTRA